MILRINESVLYEDIAAVKKYYPNIPDNTFMELIALDPTYTGKDSVGKYGKWILNLFNRGKISEKDFEEIPELLNQFTTYKNRIQNKDLNAYKTLDDLAGMLASVIDDMSMLTPSQKTKFLKRVKSGRIMVDKSEDYDIVLDTPNFIVYVPNTHEASMKLGKGTKWCTAHENPDWYNDYTKNGGKLYIIKNKKTGERWQYSDDTGDFLDENDDEFDIMSLLGQDDAKQLSKFFEKFLGVDYYNFDGTLIYTGKAIPDSLSEHIEYIIISDNVTVIDDFAFSYLFNLKRKGAINIYRWAYANAGFHNGVNISMKNAKIYFSGNPDKITKDFIRDYVEAGVQEINEKTDLHIDYKLNRKGTGRAYSSITFYIDKVKNVGSRLPDYEKPTPEAQEETQQDLMMQNLIDEYRNNYIDTDFLLEDEEYSPFD